MLVFIKHHYCYCLALIHPCLLASLCLHCLHKQDSEDLKKTTMEWLCMHRLLMHGSAFLVMRPSVIRFYLGILLPPADQGISVKPFYRNVYVTHIKTDPQFEVKNSTGNI